MHLVVQSAKILQTKTQWQLEIQKHIDQSNCNLTYLMEVAVFMLCMPIYAKDDIQMYVTGELALQS